MDILHIPKTKRAAALRAMDVPALFAAVRTLQEAEQEVPPSAVRRLEQYGNVLRMREFDNSFGYLYLAGVDEAGRGPLAGDVYTAAVVFDKGVTIEGLNDSKKLSPAKREALYDVICERALAYHITTASVARIDEINIRNATYESMCASVRGLRPAPEYVLVDGDAIRNLTLPHECVIKGDATSLSIAAASILAKVSRDRYMLELDKQYPEYGFAKHKGYGTSEHIDAIRKYGPCPLHRRSFLTKILGDKPL